MDLTEEQVLALAPDDSSRKAGKELASGSKWQKKEINEIALWGACQGSGKDPYLTQVDLRNIAFKCSCPSRKFPCKHGLALLVLYARDKSGFKMAEPPSWVTDWISKRVEKEEIKKEAAAKPVDEEAQAKRKEEREKKVARGVEDLQLWMKDIVRNGILNLPEKNFSYWDTMAKRMVDAQASGLSGMVRALGQTNFYAEGWQSNFLYRMIRLFLLSEAYKNMNELGPDQQAEIRALIGFSSNLEELKNAPGQRDNWLVLGMQSSEENNLITEKTWLYGQKSAIYAVQLQFFVTSQVPENRLMPGMAYDAELVFFPGIMARRAIVKHQFQSKPISEIAGFSNLDASNAYEAEVSAKNPFADEHSLLVDNVKLVPLGESWLLRDANGKVITVKNEPEKIWKLLALSGAKPVPVFITGKENNYELRGVQVLENYYIL